MRYVATLAVALAATAAAAQPAPRTPRVHALVGARVVLEPGKDLEKATVVVRDGIVVAAGAGVAVPADARVWDMTGRTIYPGFVEPWWRREPEGSTAAGAHSEGIGRRRRGAPPAPATPAPEPAKGGAGHDNPRVHPEQDVASTFAPKPEELADLRAAGFTAAHLVPHSGVFRGRSAVLSLRDGGAAQAMLRMRFAHVVAFERDAAWGRPSTYPSSVMGSVALVRQTLLDADWARRSASVYAERGAAGLERPAENAALVALAGALPAWGGEPVWIETGDVLGTLRSGSVAREFGLAAVLVGAGDEYRWLDAVRDGGFPLVVPVAFPEAPPVGQDDDEALDVDLEELHHWEMAPANPARLGAAGVTFAVTSQGLDRRSKFLARLRTAVEHGLSADAALAALTVVPARLLGADRQLGRIAPGMAAHLAVADGDLFADGTSILEVWVDGQRYEVQDRKRDDADRVRGSWKMTGRDSTWTLRVRGPEWALEAVLVAGADSAVARDVTWRQGELRVALPSRALRLRPTEKKQLRGVMSVGGEASHPIEATRIGRQPKEKRDEGVPEEKHEERADSKSARKPPVEVAWPPRPAPAPRALLVRGATIWTSGPAGTLAEADLLAVGGKIVKVGKGLDAPAGATVIDGRGLHLTPGLIDCHSHSDIVGGVNEGTNICTAEVRIADVLNAESIAIYRELAGGLTAANQLHGSANSIGGQNAVIKLRWGAPPEKLLLAGAPPGIKFALGENPKQSNWGSEGSGRYPQTRMGVEQSIRERFLAARDYVRTWDAWRSKGAKAGLPPRRDLQLEAIAEVLRGERLVHCHSYRQDEILMMMRLAEEFGFRVATFQHVLEGYKVADEMAAHGAGGSCFSDWWAYKFEVYDAIPYAGALMRQRGVLVSFNSDSSELARHLNLEAAKAVKYGGVPEEEALRFVTLHAAQQLRIDGRVGSLEPGKDADFAIWSGHPLAPDTRCEQTWIEGRRYFDRSADLAARQAMLAARRELVARARAAAERGGREEGERGPRWKPGYLDEDRASCHEEMEVRP
jgi:imidazolonepropionase-like amidohydrolase